MAQVKEQDPHLGSGPDEDSFEGSVFDEDSDSGSLLSEDSVFPDYERGEKAEGTTSTLYEACARNEAATLRRVLERGVTQEEVMELDINGRNGLMLAVSKGFVDVVYGLHICPFVDINHQDNDGNTALMIAAQAGFVTILNYILNYYSGVDTELRDTRGFTALIKAAMQGREDCVSALIMQGADLNAVDSTRGKGIMDWALITGRFETRQKLRQLIGRPSAEQFCATYVPEWPQLKDLVAKATGTKSMGGKIVRCLRNSLTFNFPHDPKDNGVLDHMVKMTTGIHSPLVATSCRPLCPTSPPEMGKRRLAVPDLVRKHPGGELEECVVCHSNGSLSSASPFSSSPSIRSSSSVSLASCSSSTKSGGSILSMASNGVRKILPHSIAHRNSVFPSSCIPKIKVTKSGEPTPKKEKKRKPHKGHLDIPVWKYKEAKEEKKKLKEKGEKEKGNKSGK